MYKSFKKPCLILLSALVAAMLVLACAFMLSPKTTAHADAEETHDHSAMTAINSYADIENGELTAGAYYLGENIDGNITVTGEVTLCLNGHTVTGDGTGSVITVSENASFTLCDCQDTGKLTGGTGNTNEMSDFTNGGGVCVYGTFTMYGGKISGNTASFGGGVLVEGGTFTMYGGTIELNTAENSGGGVVVSNVYNNNDELISNGEFTMYDGTISSNEAMISGGVYVIGGTFTMIDGMINGNTGTYAVGGVLVLGTFKISGGDIIGNEQTNDIGFGTCGGVCVGLSMFADEDVEIVFEISGAPMITANKVTIDGNAVENNVVLDEGYKITVAGELTFGALIGVSNTGTVATGFTQDDKPSEYFISDNSEYDCIYVSDETGTVTIGTHTFAEDFTVDTPASCTGAGSKSKHCTHCDEKSEVTEIPATGHTLTHNEATAATEEKEGNSEYWSCGECDKYFEDEAGENEITDKTSVVISKLTPTTPTEPTEPAPDNSGSDKTPTAPAEEKKSYWWLFLLLIPIAIGVGGVTLGIYDYKKQKENNQ